MTVLRSREIASTKTAPHNPKTKSKLEPSTPAQTHKSPTLQSPPTAAISSSQPQNPNPTSRSNPKQDFVGSHSDSPSVAGVVRRRSLRLASKSPDSDGSKNYSSERSRKRDTASGDKGTCSMAEKVAREAVGKEVGVSNRELGFYLFGKRVTAAGDEEGTEGLGELGQSSDVGSFGANGSDKKRKLEIDFNLSAAEGEWEDGRSKGVLSLRSGKKVAKRGVDGGNNGELGVDLSAEENGSVKSNVGFGSGEKEKGKLGESGFVINGVDVVEDSEEEMERSKANVFRRTSLRGTRKLSGGKLEGNVGNIKDGEIARENGIKESGFVCNGVDVVEDSEEEVERSNKNAFRSNSLRGKRKLSGEIESVVENIKDGAIATKNGINMGGSDFVFLGVEEVVEDSEEEVERSSDNTLRRNSLRGKRKLSGSIKGVVENTKDNVTATEIGMNMGESGFVFNGVDVLELGSEDEVERSSENVFQSTGSGGKRKLSDAIGGVVENMKDDVIASENGIDIGRRRYNRTEKGKGKLVGDASLLNVNDAAQLGVESEVLSSVDNLVSSPIHIGENVASHDERQVKNTNTRENSSGGNEYMERFRDIARRNAARFANFSSEEEVNDSSPQVEVAQDIEDWPGPFSTAMKIIKDRASKNGQVPSEDQNQPASVKWVPKKFQDRPLSKNLIPSLQDLCLSVLAKNADAIASLEHVADALRHRLSQLLCDSRRMDSHFFELLVQGSPTEVRVRDCSWMTEDEFTKSFQHCDTSTLTVLQLDQCGRCVPDYILQSTLARSFNCLPALITLSLSGACRLSDAGLGALVASAPALRSLNLSQCSLLTSSSINTLADSLGSVLKELYLNDCQGIEAMLILPALKKLEHLEVFSLAGVENVSDDFIRELITARGHNLKELVLTDCVKLTDLSVKIIAETCSGLCALDLINLNKLTDFTLGYLANGCKSIQTLKFCRNAFSDEAIAAFLETCGESLNELSLNNIKKVGHNTATSLAKRSRKLHTLDLSWCRNLTDETLGLIVDSCLSLRILKLFGCTQITNTFLDGHSNPEVRIIGLKVRPILEHVKVPDPHEGPLRYSPVF